MSIDERELRSRLAEAAALAGPPRFTTDDLAARVRRISRRRRRRTGVIAAVSVAAVASAVAILLTRGGTSQPIISTPGSLPPDLSYTVTANGQTRAVATGTALPLFTITPGENLRIKVGVTIPAHVRVTALWLGISKGSWGSGPNGPTGINYPMLAHTRKSLGPGSYSFRLRWTVPAGLRPGTIRYLATAWSFREAPTGEVARAIADFAAPLPSRAASPAAVTRRLRTLALHAVAICDGARPAWIRAVRTSFSKAMAVPWWRAGDETADDPSDAVYLVLMKGDFILSSGGPVPSCAQAPTGHYFSAIVDAATFVTLEAGVGNRPPPVPLRTLGPLLNLR